MRRRCRHEGRAAGRELDRHTWRREPADDLGPGAVDDHAAVEAAAPRSGGDPGRRHRARRHVGPRVVRRRPDALGVWPTISNLPAHPRQAGRRVLHVRPRSRQEPRQAHRRRPGDRRQTSSAAWRSSRSSSTSTARCSPVGSSTQQGRLRSSAEARRCRRRRTSDAVNPRWRRAGRGQRARFSTTGNTPSARASAVTSMRRPSQSTNVARAAHLLDGARRVAVGRDRPSRPASPRVARRPSWSSDQRARSRSWCPAREEERPVLGDRRGPRLDAADSNVVGASRSVESAPPREMNAAMPHVARRISAITATPPSTGTTARASGERSRAA